MISKTRQDYNLIAKDYARTRAYIPQDIKKLGDFAKAGEKILDLGCANGRLYEVFQNKTDDFYGVDFSEELIGLAKKKYPQAKFIVSSAFSLPFPDNFFDKVYSISVLHHIPSKELRIKYLQEARRVLKKEGLLILRVWDFWKRKEIWRLVVKFIFLKLIGRSKLDINDIFFPWKDSQGKVLADRYFHCFTKKELENLVREAGFKIKKSWRDGQDSRANIYSLAEKLT